jgi:hypothetical protein
VSPIQDSPVQYSVAADDQRSLSLFSGSPEEAGANYPPPFLARGHHARRGSALFTDQSSSAYSSVAVATPVIDTRVPQAPVFA